MKQPLAATGLALLLGCSGGGGPVLPPGGGMAGNLGQTGGVGGGSIPPAANVMDILVDWGPNEDYMNGLFATVTLCQPGTGNCQPIDHMLVDTGSVGLRVLESLLTLELPDVVSASGQTLAECRSFVDSSMWGPLKTADVVLGGETATGLAIQLLGQGRYSVPATCTGAPITDVVGLAANGILGVGTLLHSCGSACALPASSLSNPGIYYACSGPATCSVASVPVGQQLLHPVAALPVDNNGVIIHLPSVGASGAPSVPGQMVLGIGTQTNNGLGSATLLAVDRYGDSSTTFPVGGTAYVAIVDSGSNALFFLDSATTGLKQCTGGLKDFYCPASTTSLSATILGAAGSDVRVDFSVANLAKLPAAAFAFNNVAGPMPGYPLDTANPAFDWGLPFFFGRTVYTAIEGMSTEAGTGPFVAF
jgi:hypothetical protein